MIPETKANRNIGEIMKSDVSLRSENVWVKAISFILITSVVMLVGAVASVLLTPYENRISTPAVSHMVKHPDAATSIGKDALQKNVANDPDDANINVIKKYYELLSGGKISQAYALRENNDVSLKDFTGWYSGIEYARPENFKGLQANIYDFVVKYKDKGEAEKEYGVRMMLDNGKLSTASSSEFVAAEAKFGAYEAFSVVRGEKAYLILKKDGKETIVDVGEYGKRAISEGFYESFEGLLFSPKGNYLMYTITGYEFSAGKVYDIKGGKNALGEIGTTAGKDLNVTPDEKYFYVCRSNGMDAAIPGEIYSIPGFKKVFDAAPGNEGYMNYECRYSQKDNAIVFTFSESFDENDKRAKVVKYPLE